MLFQVTDGTLIVLLFFHGTKDAEDNRPYAGIFRCRNNVLHPEKSAPWCCGQLFEFRERLTTCIYIPG